MAFVTVPTFLDNIAFLTADGNQYIRDNINYLKGQAGAIYLENGIEIAESASPGAATSGRGRLFVGNASPINGVFACTDDAGNVYQMLQRSFGTYSPTYQGATTGGTTTYGTQVGAWERIGDRIDFWAYVTWTAATGTGAVLISLPFTARNTANLRGTCAVCTTGVTFSGSGVQGLILPNTASVQLSSPLSNNTRADVSIEAAGEINLQGVFYV